MKKSSRVDFSKGKIGGKLANAELVKIVLAVVFAALILIPLIRMFFNLDSASLQSVLNSEGFGTALKNSLVSTTIATLITITLAYVIALCVERTDIRLKSIFGIIFVLPMLIPSISNGMGLIILFGNNGIVTNMLGVESGIYGLPGIVMGSVLYAFPVAYLMLADVMAYENNSPYEAARVLGVSRFHQFKDITLPYLRKPLIAIVFAIFTLIITDYGVPLMVGGKYNTIPVVMYHEVIGQLNFGKGVVYGCVLLVPAVLAFIIDLKNKDAGNSGFITKPIEPSNDPARKVLAYVLCIAGSIFIMLPIISFVILGFATDYPTNLAFTFDNIQQAIGLKAGGYLMNSIIIAVLVAIIGVLIAFVTAYMTARMKNKTSRLLHMSVITTAAIPGMVLGLSYVLVFKSSFIYGTIAILIMVNIVHFISSPYLMMYNSFGKLNENLEGVGHTLGISRLHMIKDVFIPQCKSTIAEMLSYFFVNCMMTISAVSFLATTSNKPVSLMINQFEAQRQMECAAIISLAILVVNVTIKGIVWIHKNKGIANKNNEPTINDIS